MIFITETAQISIIVHAAATAFLESTIGIATGLWLTLSIISCCIGIVLLVLKLFIDYESPVSEVFEMVDLMVSTWWLTIFVSVLPFAVFYSAYRWDHACILANFDRLSQFENVEDLENLRTKMESAAKIKIWEIPQPHPAYNDGTRLLKPNPNMEPSVDCYTYLNGVMITRQEILKESQRLTGEMEAGPDKTKAEEYLCEERTSVISLIEKARKFRILAVGDMEFCGLLSVQDAEDGYEETDCLNLKLSNHSSESIDMSDKKKIAEMV